MADKETLKALNCINNWEEIIIKLTAYASILSERYSWRTKDSYDLAQGMTPEDIALDSIKATFEGERKWNREKCPDILYFLKGVVKSKISNLLISIDNKSVDRIGSVNYQDDEEIDLIDNLPDDNSFFLETIYEKELLQTITDKVLSLNDELLYCVLDERVKGFSNKEIAINNGIPIKDVENSIKKIRRQVESIRETKKIKIAL